MLMLTMTPILQKALIMITINGKQFSIIKMSTPICEILTGKIYCLALKLLLAGISKKNN
jgi:hypothetical protein